MGVYAAGISVKVARLTLGGLSLGLSATDIERCRDGVAEVSRGRSSGGNRCHEGLNMVNRE